MLPSALLLLTATLDFKLVSAQDVLALNVITSFTPSSPSKLPVFLPSAKTLTITIALCTPASDARFFVTNSSAVNVPSSAGGEGVFEIQVNEGNGNWTGSFAEGGILAVENLRQTAFEVGVSEDGPLHEALELPLLGDTTSNQAVIFSPPSIQPDISKPKWPNYTLPAANPSLPVIHTSPPSFTLILTLTSSSLNAGPQTACMLSTQASAGTIANGSQWLRDQDRWRTEWFVQALMPSTNYTAYVVQDGAKLSKPIFFATKSATFSCPLVYNLPYCPNVAYPVPLPLPPNSAPAYTADNLPSNITDPLLSSLTNFTTTLTTFACGRDQYSPLVECSDCQRAYRRWLCAISFTRCGEASPSNPDAVTASPVDPTATGLSAGNRNSRGGQQQVFSALVPQPPTAPARSANLPSFENAYTMLLPCLETCTAVDRACPNFLGFKCPRVNFNAAASYGVGYVDAANGGSGNGMGGEGEGVTGTAADKWGNIWCNGG